MIEAIFTYHPDLNYPVLFICGGIFLIISIIKAASFKEKLNEEERQKNTVVTFYDQSPESRKYREEEQKRLQAEKVRQSVREQQLKSQKSSPQMVAESLVKSRQQHKKNQNQRNNSSNNKKRSSKEDLDFIMNTLKKSGLTTKFLEDNDDED